MDRDTASIGGPHRPRVRFTPVWEHVDEGLATIALFVQPLKLDVGSDACIQCCVYATNHGRQMRHERKTDAPSYGCIQPLPNLWPMTMAGNTIGFEIIRSFGEEQMLFGFLSGTAHPGLRVRDQVIEVDGPGFRKRQQAELNRGRIAPGIRHQACALDSCAIRFRQTVNRLGEKLRRGVLDLVALLPLGCALDAKIGREIHDAHAGLHERPRLTHRDGVGRREKHHVALGEVRLPRVRVRKRHGTAQARNKLRYRSAGLFARSDRDELRLRVAREDAQQLDPGITGPAHDADFDHHHLRRTGLPAGFHRTPQCPGSFPPAETRTANKKAARGAAFPVPIFEHQRLEYCLRRRALCRPTFFRSTRRAPPATTPSFPTTGLPAVSCSISARARPCRTAPACPNSPPPDTFTMTSNWVSLSVNTSG